MNEASQSFFESIGATGSFRFDGPFRHAQHLLSGGEETVAETSNYYCWHCSKLLYGHGCASMRHNGRSLSLGGKRGSFNREFYRFPSHNDDSWVVWRSHNG